MRKVKHRQEIFKIRNIIFSWNQIKTDRKMLFYTGLPSKSAFNTVFSLIEPSLPNMSYWRGTKRYLASRSKVKRKYVKFSTKKLSFKDEFLLTLMRLRLGLLNEDLADRFGITPSICSNTFTTWIRLVSVWLTGFLGRQ